MVLQMIIDPARLEDLPSIVALLAADSMGEGREKPGGDAADVYVRAFKAMKNQPDNHFFVARDDGEVIGCFQLSIIHGLSRSGAARAQIEAVRVKQSHRGKGIGEKMFRFAIDLAKSEGCSLVQLTTDKSRTRAKEFYERLGFVASHHGMKLEL